MHYFIDLVAHFLKLLSYDVNSLKEQGKLRDQIRLNMHDVPEGNFGNALRRLMLDRATELGIDYSDALPLVDGLISAMARGYDSANEFIRSTEDLMAMAMRLDVYGALASIKGLQPATDDGRDTTDARAISIAADSVPGTKVTFGITDLDKHLHLPEGHWVFEGVKDGVDLLQELSNKENGPDLVVSGLLSLMVKSTATGKFDLAAQLADQVAGLVSTLGKRLVETAGQSHALPEEWHETLKVMAVEDPEATGPKATAQDFARRISEMSATKNNMVPPLSTLLWTLAAQDAMPKATLESKPDESLYMKLPRDWKLTLEGLLKIKPNPEAAAFETEVVKLAKAISRCGDVKNDRLPSLAALIAVSVKPGNFSDVHLRKVERTIDAMSQIHETARAENAAK